MNTEIQNLRQFYKLIKEMSEDDIRLIYHKIDFNSLTNYFLDNELVDDDCETLIKTLQYIYNNTGVMPPISDDKYDRLYALYIDHRPDIVGAEVVSDKEIKSHRYPELRGTLDKLHYFKSEDKREKDSRRSVQDWVGSIMRAVPDIQPLTREHLEVDIYPKWDGISCVFETDESHIVDTALTRGDTEKNEAVDISRFFKGVKFEDINLCEDHPMGVKTELIMSKSDFEKVKEIEDFSSPRSVISGLFNSDEPNMELLKYLTVVPLRVQDYITKETHVIPFLDMKETSNLLDLEDLERKSLKIYNEARENYPIDGVVFVLKHKELINRLGRKDNINKYEAAFKFPAESKETILKEVIFSIGKLGGITPVAIVEPVVIKGNTITNASLGSIDRFKHLGLALGDTVEIQYEIIPYLEPVRHNGGELIEVPTHCPVCNEELKNTPLLSCVNKECPAVKIGRILNYIQKMGISFLSIGTLSKLIQAKVVTDIDDIYTLEEKRSIITSINGLGDKTLTKIVKSVKARSSVYMHQLLGSLGIDSVGRKTFKKVCEKYQTNSMSDVVAYLTNEQYLLDVEGIKQITASKIKHGLESNMDLLMEIIKHVTIKPYTSSKEVDPNAVTVYFTNVRDAEFSEFLQSEGVVIADDFNKKVKVLIIPDVEDKVSKKKEKAIKWGIQILTLSQAKEYFKYN